MKLVSIFSFKLIFSETYAHYNSFIKNTLLIYLFIHPEESIRWSYFEKSQENSCGGFSFLIKLQAPLHVFSFEFCEIKNIYFVEKLRTAASEHRIYIFFFVLILRQNRYLPLNSDRLLGKQRTMLRYRGQPSKIYYSDLVIFFICCLLNTRWDCTRSLALANCSSTYFQMTIIETLNLINC